MSLELGEGSRGKQHVVLQLQMAIFYNTDRQMKKRDSFCNPKLTPMEAVTYEDNCPFQFSKS